MDPRLCQALAAAGFDVDMEEEVPTLPIRVDPSTGRLLPPEQQDGRFLVHSGDAVCRVALEPMGQLYTGDVRAPDLSGFPNERYVPFFSVLELTAANYCAAAGRTPTDDEFARLYKELRAQPDVRGRSPLFAYLQAAARLYMSLRDVSKHEFRAVVGRLAKSAKTFRLSKRSCNYFANALAPIGAQVTAVVDPV